MRPITRREAALALGEDESRINAVDWRDLSREGAIVQLHIYRWRAETTLSATDLGITLDEDERQAWESLVSLGRKYLLPERARVNLDRIENLARASVRNASLETSWGRFIPRQRYPAWRKQIEAYQAMYWAAGRKVAESWNDLRRETLDHYRVLATMAAARAGEKSQSWVDLFVKEIDRLIIDPVEYVDRLEFWWEAQYVPLRAAEESGEVRDALEADVRATVARQAAEGLDRFVADIQANIQGRVYDAVLDVLDALRGHDRLPRRSTVQLRNLIEAVNALKFWPDDRLESRLDELAAQLDQPAHKRSTDSVKHLLRELGAESRLLLIQLNRTPRRSGQRLGIPDAPADLVRRVRRGAGQAPILLPLAVLPPTPRQQHGAISVG